MATVITPSGETLEGVEGQLLEYYQGEANTVGGYEIDGYLYPERIAESDFDPAEHTVAEVQEHLDQSTANEAQRVLDAEAADKARVTLLGDHAQADESADQPEG